MDLFACCLLYLHFLYSIFELLTDLTVGVPSAGITPVSQGFYGLSSFVLQVVSARDPSFPIIVDFSLYNFASHRGALTN